jgi:hypothetical protein
MNEPHSADDFLAAATAGLRHDRELQLDVQAELRSHLEERQLAAEAAGLATAAAAGEAVRAMGPAAGLASELELANRSRMRLRALVRLAAQWLLAPLAVAVAVLTSDWHAFKLIGVVSALSDAESSVEGFFTDQRNLTPDQRLVLDGDKTRPTRLEQQKAIWERWPTNKVYLHNYVTHLLNDYQMLGATPADQYSALRSEIETLRPIDPGNARFDFILAGKLLEEAVESESREVEGPGGKKTEYDFTVKDPAKLDEAMALFKGGLSKPDYRRYNREMAVERLAIMGKPTSMLQQISQIGMLAGVLLPDLAHMRKLHRAAVFYGERLANEGRREEAWVYLDSYRSFVPLFTSDSFTLIDVLVAGAIAGYAEDRVPAIYEKMGDPASAKRARAETARLAAPVKEWKARRRAAEELHESETLLMQHASVLAALLLPAIGEFPTLEELAPSRLIEYVVAEGFALAALSLTLFCGMLLCGFAAFYYRRMRDGGDCTLLLLPEPGEVVALLGLGVLAPLIGYYLVTRWLPWAGRDLSLLYGGVPFAAQLVVLFIAMLGFLGALAARFVRRRCRELLLPVPPPAPFAWRVFAGVMLALLAIPAVTWGAWFKPDDYPLAVMAGVFAVMLLVPGMAWAVWRLVREVDYGRSCAAYYGSLARTLLPVIALALILVNVSSRPYLRMAERRLLQSDTLMGPDPFGGFTSIESRLVHRLIAEMTKAAEGMDPSVSP